MADTHDGLSEEVNRFLGVKFFPLSLWSAPALSKVDWLNIKNVVGDVFLIIVLVNYGTI